MLGKSLEGNKFIWFAILYPLIFLGCFYGLKLLDVTFDSKDVFGIVSGVLVTLVTLMAFFAVIALFRLEGLRLRNDAESISKSEDIKENLSKVCKRIAWVVFLGLMILFWSVSSKNSYLPDAIVISALVTFLVYILSATLSFVKKENL